MNAAVNQICSCHWQGMRRVQQGIDCPVHGDDAVTATRKQLIRDREAAAVAYQIHTTEARTWLRRRRASRQRLKELNAKLKETDPCCL